MHIIYFKEGKSFDMDVIIVCHTEYGWCKNKGVINDGKTVVGVRDGVRNLIRIANKHDAKVTFAVMPETVKHFPKGVNHEIGLHIHPDDELIRECCDISLNSPALRDYPYKEQLEMIKAGKDYIEDRFGHAVKTFVAGKWSVNNDTVKALIKTGFTHDCSASQRKKFSYCDWSKLPRMCPPYRPSEKDYQEKGNLPLLIIPVSQLWRGGEVTPEIVPLVGLQWLKACFLEHYRSMPIFHIYLHSPCMTDPYFISVMDRFLHFISKYEVNFKFASEVEEYKNVNPKTSIKPYIFGINKTIILKGVPTLFKNICRR